MMEKCPGITRNTWQLYTDIPKQLCPIIHKLINPYVITCSYVIVT